MSHSCIPMSHFSKRDKEDIVSSILYGIRKSSTTVSASSVHHTEDDFENEPEIEVEELDISEEEDEEEFDEIEEDDEECDEVEPKNIKLESCPLDLKLQHLIFK